LKTNNLIRYLETIRRFLLETFQRCLTLPLVAGLRLNSDYLSGNNGLSSATFKLLYPLAKDWQLGLGVQIATAQDVSDPYQGMLGIYFH
jgi:hypothetical protein